MIDHLIHAYVFVHFKIVYSHVCMVWIGSEWLIYSGQVFVLDDQWGIGNCNRFVFEYLYYLKSKVENEHCKNIE